MINQYELLELFENDPKILGEKEAGIYEYKRKDTYGFTLKMCIFLYDEYCSLTLSYKDFKTPIFDMGFNKINSIKCKDDKLIIRQAGNPKNIVVYFKPNYTLDFEEQLT